MNGLAYDDLPDDPEALKSLLIEQDRKYARLLRHAQLEIAKLEEERRLDRANRFGASAEAGNHQANLFDEAEQADAVDSVDADTDAIEIVAHTKRRPKRKPLPADLPRVDVHHELSDSACGCCGKPMRRIGETTSEQLDVIPAQVYVTVHHRATYSCSSCDESIRTAPLPAQPIPKSVASAGLLAHVAVAKYADGLPLYRQSKQFQRLGIDLPRNTLAGHMIKIGERIDPLIDALKHHIQQHDIVQMDETPVQVLKEPGKVAQSTSYMWVMKGGPPQQPAIVYHYDPGRSQAVPRQLLGAFEGYLQTDGYAGYHAIVNESGIEGVGCWAHVRRKFMDAKKALPKREQAKGNRVQQALALIGKLYRLEQQLKSVDATERQRRRQADAVPILTQFKTWLDRQSVPPQTLLGKAIGYTQKQWPRLLVYIEDGRLNIDNNGVENAIRPFALGRKNWLFSDTQHGARASANLYSLIETAKANGLNDYAYLKYVFVQLPATGNVQSLLPWVVDRSLVDAQLTKPS